jgi:enoyl-CoA hydratase/carnithine racemase
LSGRLVDGVEAARLGMVSRVTDDPLAAALDWAEVVAGMPPAAVAATRSNVYRGLEVDLATDLQSLEIRAQVGALFGDEFRQRFDAYRQALERR